MIKFKARDGRAPQELAAMDMAAYLGDKHRKKHYIQVMFETIAPGYDSFTRFFSFGMDKKWKEALLAETERRTPEHAFILDLACGTGDLGIQLARRTGATRSVGLDLSQLMLGQARDRSAKENISFRLAACDMLQLCVPEASVDVVTIGYGLRNTADVSLALREVARCSSPRGSLPSSISIAQCARFGAASSFGTCGRREGFADGCGTASPLRMDTLLSPSADISPFLNLKSS